MGNAYFLEKIPWVYLRSSLADVTRLLRKQQPLPTGKEMVSLMPEWALLTPNRE